MSSQKNQAHQDEREKQKYSEPKPIRLTQRDSIAFVNSIRFPGQPNELVKEMMRKPR